MIRKGEPFNFYLKWNENVFKNVILQAEKQQM